MSIDINKYKGDILGVIKSANKVEPISAESILRHLGLPVSEANRLKRYIASWRRIEEDDNADISVVTSNARGFYIPDTPYECKQLRKRRVATANGFLRAADRFGKREEKLKLFEQLKLFKDEGSM